MLKLNSKVKRKIGVYELSVWILGNKILKKENRKK